MTSLIFGISIWLIIKIAILVLLGIYIMFCLIVIRQIKLITSTLSLGFESTITTFGYIHLTLAIVIFLAALIIL